MSAFFCLARKNLKLKAINDLNENEYFFLGVIAKSDHEIEFLKNISLKREKLHQYWVEH